MSNTRNKFSLEVRARAVRMVLENEDDYSSRWAAITSISSKIGCVPQKLSSWVKRKEVDSVQGPVCRLMWPTKYYARHLRILHRRNSTARTRNDALHR